MNDISVYTHHFEITPMFIDPLGKLGLHPLLSLIQDSASMHAHQLGFGRDEMLKNGAIWVLSRQILKMEYWPQKFEKIQIKTWIRAQEGPFSVRDFEFFQDDKLIGECSTSWVGLDFKSRRPIIIDRSKLLAKIKDMGKVSLETQKILPLKSPDLINLMSLRVKNSDLDQNSHVNNTKYALWILDSLPLRSANQGALAQYEINFLAETKLGDEIMIQTDQKNHYQGLRISDQKIVFTANLSYKS